jgi:hypothetical protein
MNSTSKNDMVGRLTLQYNPVIHPNSWCDNISIEINDNISIEIKVFTHIVAASEVEAITTRSFDITGYGDGVKSLSAIKKVGDDETEADIIRVGSFIDLTRHSGK